MIDTNPPKLIPLKTFLDSEKVIYPTRWMEDENIIVLHASDNVSDTEFEEFYLDLNTYKITTPTPTP
jgi:hypothetical protein